MSKITPDAIRHVASVARLNLSASEVKKFQTDLEEILKSFDVINSIPTECEPSFQPLEVELKFMEDIEEKCLDNPLANTKHSEKGFFRGPKVV